MNRCPWFRCGTRPRAVEVLENALAKGEVSQDAFPRIEPVLSGRRVIGWTITVRRDAFPPK